MQKIIKEGMQMDTKSSIMETTFKLFLKKGFNNVSLNEIIKESGITTGGFYYHFDSKDTLIVEVIKKYIFNYFNFTIEQIRDFEGTHKEKLKTVILSIVGDDGIVSEATQLCEGYKIDYRTLHILLVEGIQKYDVIREHYAEFHYKMFDFIKEVVDDGVTNGIIRSDIASNELSLVIHTNLLGNILTWIGMPGISLEHIIQLNLDNLWNYISNEV